MSIAKLNAESLCGVDTGIHAGQDKVLLGGREHEVALGEGRRISLRGGLDVLLDGAHIRGCEVKMRVGVSRKTRKTRKTRVAKGGISTAKRQLIEYRFKSKMRQIG